MPPSNPGRNPVLTRAVDYCEQYYLLHSNLPDSKHLAGMTGYTREAVNEVLNSQEFYDAMQRRGINSTPVGFLSGAQLAVANAILDFSDTRSEKKKLADLGVTTATYQAWLRDPVFSQYLRERSEAIISDNLHEAHLGLMDNVRRGDLNSIKLYYEMTGRWSSKTVGELNVEFLLVKIIEVIQRHVTDPVALSGIANELELLSPSGGTNQRSLASGY